MYSQLSKELKASLFQRIKSPFFGSYLIGLFIFNYRFVFLMMSNKSLEEKFKIIEDTTSIIGATPTFYTTLLFPFLFALFYIAIVPLFESYISMPIWKKNQNRLKKKYAELEKQEVFLAEEKSKYLKEILDIRREKEKLIEELTNHDLTSKKRLEDELKKIDNNYVNKIKLLETDNEIKQKDALKKLEESLTEQFNSHNESLKKDTIILSTQVEEKKNIIGSIEQKLHMLEKNNKNLLIKEELLKKYDNNNQKLLLENQNQKNINNELLNKIINIEKDLKDYKKKEKAEKEIESNRLKGYLKMFSSDEINYLRAIYENNIESQVSAKILTDKLVQILKMPRLKIEHLTDKMINQKYLSNQSGFIFIKPELKKLLIEMFN